MKNALSLLSVNPLIIAGIAIGAVVIATIAIVAAVIVSHRKSAKSKDALDASTFLKPDLHNVSRQDENKPSEAETVEEPVPVKEVVEQAEEPIEAVAEPAPAEEPAPAVEEVVETQPSPGEEPVEEPAPVEETVQIAETAPVDTAAPAVEEEAAAEPEPVREEPAAEQIEEPEPVVDEERAETKTRPVVVRRVAPAGKVFIRVRYNRSYTAKIIQAEDVLKDYYTQIKNEILSYKKVKERISWRHETFRSGRKLLVRFAVRGKTLNVYLALNPADYAESKYKIKDVSHVAKNKDVPTLYKINNDRRLKYVKELIAEVMSANGIVAGEPAAENYAAQYPYEPLEPLIERNLVKLLTWEDTSADYEVGEIAVPEDSVPDNIAIVPAEEEIAVAAEEPVCEEEPDEIDEAWFAEEDTPAEEQEPETSADVNMSISLDEAEEILDDRYVEVFVRQGSRTSDRTKKAVINIDTLGKYFEKGERVTVEEIKKRIPSTGKKVTYIKVLARGTLDKALTVEADDFSPAAIKMIVLTGGEVIRTKRT